MSVTDELPVATSNTVSSDPISTTLATLQSSAKRAAAGASIARDATKDPGRVHVGGGFMRF